MENVPDAFGSFVGKLVKIVYRDCGGETKVRKGTLESVDSEFLKLVTREHSYLIQRSTISELSTVEEGHDV